MKTKSLLELIPSDYLKKGSRVKALGKVEEIFCLKDFKQFKIDGNFYHEKIVSCAMTSSFKMNIAKRLICDNFKVKRNRSLIKDLYQINRYIQVLTQRRNTEELIEGGYYKILASDSASGLVPVDPWLLVNLEFAKTQVEKELTKRILVSNFRFAVSITRNNL